MARDGPSDELVNFRHGWPKGGDFQRQLLIHRRRRAVLSVVGSGRGLWSVYTATRLLCAENFSLLRSESGELELPYKVISVLVDRNVN